MRPGLQAHLSRQPPQYDSAFAWRVNDLLVKCSRSMAMVEGEAVVMVEGAFGKVGLVSSADLRRRLLQRAEVL